MDKFSPTAHCVLERRLGGGSRWSVRTTQLTHVLESRARRSLADARMDRADARTASAERNPAAHQKSLGNERIKLLHLKPAARYSEDIDLVQTPAEPAGPMMEALREVLDPWLGTPQWKQTAGRVTIVYRFNSEDTPLIRLRLKVEINSREHFAVYGFTHVPFAVSSRWFEGKCQICSYELDELLVFASRSNRCSRSPSPANAAGRIFSATSRSRLVSRARYDNTVAKLEAP